MLTGQLQVIATTYVYPAPVDVKVFPLPSVGEAPDWFVKNYFQRVQAEIVQRHKGARLVAEERVQVRQAGRLHSGWRCEYAFSESFALTGLPQPLRSEAYLFTHGAWFVKYRFTYPEPQADAAREAIATFMRDLSWPARK